MIERLTQGLVVDMSNIVVLVVDFIKSWDQRFINSIKLDNN